jgi:hypothetical protein
MSFNEVKVIEYEIGNEYFIKFRYPCYKNYNGIYMYTVNTGYKLQTALFENLTRTLEIQQAKWWLPGDFICVSKLNSESPDYFDYPTCDIFEIEMTNEYVLK